MQLCAPSFLSYRFTNHHSSNPEFHFLTPQLGSTESITNSATKRAGNLSYFLHGGFSETCSCYMHHFMFEYLVVVVCFSFLYYLENLTCIFLYFRCFCETRKSLFIYLFCGRLYLVLFYLLFHAFEVNGVKMAKGNITMPSCLKLGF